MTVAIDTKGNDIRCGAISASSINVTGDGITNSEIADNANIGAEKVEQQYKSVIRLDGTVVDDDRFIHIAENAGELYRVVARIATPPTVDAEITIDVQKVANGSAAGSGTSLMGSVITLDNATTADSVEVGTIATSNAYAGDEVLEVIIDETTNAGVQGSDLIVEVFYREITDA